MRDWTAGYVAEIGYTFGYYTELNPLRVRLAFLNAGLALPEGGTACELGFGQGMSANLHAAASVTQWFGTDFNPSQAAFAQELAGISGSGARLFDEAFEHFCARGDLPEFDFIGLHGIWSWISVENRAVIVDFVRRKLKVGGVLYISYNTQPGWASLVPLRHLLTRHAEVMGAPGSGILSRIDGAMAFTEKLFATEPGYLRGNPHIADRFKKLQNQNRNYLAHEYFNRDWAPMHFAEMADCLAPAKLSYAVSAHYLDHADLINLTPDQRTLLNDIPDQQFRESVRDFMVNQQFRRDYWVKGGRKLTAMVQANALRAQRVILVTPRAEVSLKVNGSLGEATMTEAIYAPILDVLADHLPHAIGEIEQRIQGQGVIFAQLREAMMLLIGKGDLQPAQDETIVTLAKPRSDRLNRHVMEAARDSNNMHALASPVTGGGITLGRFQQLFLMAHLQGLTTPAALADFVWKALVDQGERIIKDGKTLETEVENRDELLAQASEFVAKRLPILKSLQIG